jgi:hypothetical protein
VVHTIRPWGDILVNRLTFLALEVPRLFRNRSKFSTESSSRVGHPQPTRERQGPLYCERPGMARGEARAARNAKNRAANLLRYFRESCGSEGAQTHRQGGVLDNLSQMAVWIGEYGFAEQGWSTQAVIVTVPPRAGNETADCSPVRVCPRELARSSLPGRLSATRGVNPPFHYGFLRTFLLVILSTCRSPSALVTVVTKQAVLD